MFGGSVLSGDLVKSNWGSLDEINFAYGLMLRRYFHSNLGFRANLLHTRLTASEEKYEFLDNRGVRTQTPVTELSFDFELDFLGHRREKPGRRTVSPYVLVGMGFAFTNPETYYTDTDKETLLDQNIAVSSTRFVLPIGAGLRVDISPQWALGVEVATRATFSDYLDGVSLSGNPHRNDWYGFGSVQVWRRLPSRDRDGDGIANEDDSCPDIAGTEQTAGCPDRDGDGITDDEDECPDFPGVRAFAGCPDTDRDGIKDEEDACPTQPGSKQTGGCPDSDGDGIADALDNCPETPGYPNFRGCPEGDTDFDGIDDHEDKCPTVAGPAANGGCPYVDTDGDGIWDRDDKCPYVVGTSANKGCPEGQPNEESQRVLDFATRNVRFAYNKDELLSTSFAILDRVVKLMQDYPGYKLLIEGFTDNLGSRGYNQRLSEARARRCYSYLIRKGISAERMEYAGWGEANPIGSNDTEAGRLQNRRVEFSLFK